eukprot:TRINITY_DN10324_c0_g6_i1.p1 TRINITY_DN10324_c0_g6~~TRINITY_DN10324_c0_g6_i1.p1  ORF type:complete len:245 (+),score=36.84 TRINITY_DN10324_c0_g6_i1:108-842(+)
MIPVNAAQKIIVFTECVFTLTPIYALYYTQTTLLSELFLDIIPFPYIETKGAGFVTSYHSGIVCMVISGVIATIAIICLELRLARKKKEKKSLNIVHERPFISTELNKNVSERYEDVVVEMERVCKVYSDGFEALRNVSLDIPRGCIFGLLGPNGAGKSTLFNIATLQTQRSDGDILIEGKSIYADGKDHNKFSLCPQTNPHWEYLTVEEHIQFISQLKGLSLADAKTQVHTHSNGRRGSCCTC